MPQIIVSYPNGMSRRIDSQDPELLAKWMMEQVIIAGQYWPSHMDIRIQIWTLDREPPMAHLHATSINPNCSVRDIIQALEIHAAEQEVT